MRPAVPTPLPTGRPVRLDIASLSDDELDRLVAFDNAVQAELNPTPPAAVASEKLGTYRCGWDGEPPEVYAVRQPSAAGDLIGSEPIATLEVWAPAYDNRTMAYLDVRVRADQRRHGMGSALLAFGEARAADLGRTVVGVDHRADHPAAAAFVARHGYTPVLHDVWRRLALVDIDADRLATAVEQARAHARDYELLRVAGPLPAHLLAGSAQLEMALNDAPRDGSAHEDEVFTPDRIRALELANAISGRRLYRVLARCRDDGQLAGHTVLATQPRRPEHAEQYSTGVAREHRGHRLGLLLKADMLAWLTGPHGPDPQLRMIDTYNADSNAQMIRINELLGFGVMAHSWQCEKRLGEQRLVRR